MRVTTVQSTTLATVIYDEAREVLQLEFLSRALYQYSGVPREVHEALLSAPSKGRYFNQAIRGRFPFARISPSPSPEPEVPAPDRASEEARNDTVAGLAAGARSPTLSRLAGETRHGSFLTPR